MNNTKKEIQDWINAEERAGRSIDEDRLNQYIQLLTKRHNNTPRDEFNGLSPEEMNNIMYFPFSSRCVVKLNKLDKEQYERIPLVRQTIFLLKTLSEKELKLTQCGWLPLKVVADTYHLGQPEWIVEEYGAKRYYEYEVGSVWMARIILELFGWIKTRKGMLSLTAKGKKALSNIDMAANKILLVSLTRVGIHTFDGYEEDRIGNLGMAYSVWLLNKYGSEWHSGEFYKEHYQKAFHFPGNYKAYETRVFSRLFYWLGIVEQRLNRQVGPPFKDEYKKTDLLSIILSFKKM